MDIVIELIVRLMVWLSRWAPMLSRFGVVRFERWHPGERWKILLVGYNGARNTGADARVVALVDQLYEEFGSDNVELTVMTLNPENIKGYFPQGVKILPFPTFFCWSLLRAASSHHAALLCEGSTLTHTFADALSMFFCQAAGIMKRQGKPCVAYGSDVTRLHRRLSQLSKTMCSDVHFIARSKPSLSILNDMGFHAEAGTDTAWTFTIPAEKNNARQQLLAQGWDGTRPLLGVAVINPYCWPVRPSLWRWVKAVVTSNRSLQYDRMYFFRDSKKRRDNYLRYLSQMAQAINTYAKSHDAFVVIIGMEKLDTQACHDFSAMVECAHAVVTSRDSDVFQMTSMLHQLDVLVTSRYHAAVLSMLKAIPLVAVSMDNRLDGLFCDIGFHDRYLHHVGDKDLAERVVASLAEAETHALSIVADIHRNNNASRKVLKDMSTQLKQILNNI